MLVLKMERMIISYFQVAVFNLRITGCSMRVETLGNFEGKSDYQGGIEVPWKITDVEIDFIEAEFGTLEKLPRQNSGFATHCAVSFTFCNNLSFSVQ